jgi:transglutaminase-like putative cysteine protease
MSTVLEAPAGHRAGTPVRDRRFPTDLRHAAVALAASWLSVAALLAVLRSGVWLTHSMTAMAVIIILGTFARAVRLPRPLIVVAQLIIGLGLVIALQVSKHAPGGFVPGPGALRDLGHRLNDGVGDLTHTAYPMHPTPGVNTLIVLSAVGAAIAVDALVVSYHRAEVGGAVLVALYAVPGAVLPNGWRGSYFVLPTLAFLMLLLDDNIDRARSWGSETIVEPGAAARRVTVQAGAVVLVLAVAIGGLPNITHGLFKHSGIGYKPPQPLQTLDPLKEMRDYLRSPDNPPLIDHQTNSNWPDEEYLDAVTLDEFDGKGWRAGNRSVTKFDGTLPPPILGPDVPVAQVNAQLHGRTGIRSDYLPMPRPATDVQVKGDWRLAPETGDVLSFTGHHQVDGKSWTVTAEDRDPDPKAITGTVTGGPTVAAYLELPADLPPLIISEAKRITATAHSALEAGRALQEYFRNAKTFTYDTGPAGSGGDAIKTLLATKHGDAEQFAAVVAVMARTLDIPARVAVGFTAGQVQADGSRLISGHDAHAWPELFLPQVGWTRFEPTPGVASSQPRPLHWLTVAKPKASPKPKPEKQQPQQSESQPQPQPQQSSGGQDSCANNPTNCQHKPPPVPHDHFADRRAAALLALAILLFLAAPRLLRTAVTRRRWARCAALARMTQQNSANATFVARMAWWELRDAALDLGYSWPRSRTPRQAGDVLTERAAFTPDAVAELDYLLTTVERIRYAPAVEHRADHLRLRTAVLRVRDDLAAAAPRVDRVRAAVLPRTLWQILRDWLRPAVATVRARISSTYKRFGSGSRRRASAR